MGFFDSIKNKVTETIASNQGQSEEEIISSINRLKENDKIKGNAIIEALLENYTDYPKIGFGIESSVDSNHIYITFQIPEEEVIVAVLKGKEKGISLASEDKIVITDKALYLLPDFVMNVIMDRDDYAEDYENRFPLESMCRFMLQKNDSGNEIYLENASGVYPVVKAGAISSVVSKVSSKKTAEDSLYSIINRVQKVAYENFDNAKSDKDTVVDWIAALAKKDLETGIFSTETKVLITRIVWEHTHDSRMGFLNLENHIHMHSSYGVNLEIEALIKIHGKEVVYDWFEKTVTTFIDKLKNPNCFNDEEHLLQTLAYIFIEDDYNKIEENEDEKSEFLQKFSYEWELVNVYMAIRRSPDTAIKDIIEYLKKKEIAEEEQKSILKCAFYLRNKKMTQAFETIKNGGKIDSDWFWLMKNDSFGLTPLHYGVLLGNDKSMKKLVEYYNAVNVDIKELEEDLSVLYNLVMVAIANDRQDYADKMLDNLPELEPLKKSLKGLKARKFILDRYIAKADSTILTAKEKMRNAKREGATEEQLERMQDSIENVKENRNDKKEFLKGIEADILEIEMEIQCIKNAIAEEAMEAYKRIEAEEDSITKLLHTLYSSADTLYEYLTMDFSEMELYEDYGQIFFIPKDFVGAKAKREQRKEENTEADTEEYTQKWFSDEAYEDIEILRKEYHVLVSKYHPDNNPNGLKAFLSIQKERAEILEELTEEE